MEGPQSEAPLSQGNRSQFPQALGYNKSCESHQPEPLVIRDNAWPSVLKDIPGSPEAGTVLPSALAFCPPSAACRGWGPPGDSFLPAAGSGGSGHTFPAAPLLFPAPTLLARLLHFLPTTTPNLSGSWGWRSQLPRRCQSRKVGAGVEPSLALCF